MPLDRRSQAYRMRRSDKSSLLGTGYWGWYQILPAFYLENLVEERTRSY